ncbi:MAG: hypothetical protein GDA35_01905 [Hyphomonadaceae bacterium]|nr:hypothetical protein [Hyphomonadaceae bacterium]
MDLFMSLLPERVASDNMLRKVGALIGVALAGRWARFVRSLAGRVMTWI